MSELKIDLQVEFIASPLEIYHAWLDNQGHENLTGGEAEISAEIGAAFSVWDGYITGKILELEPGKRILQTWRTSEFKATDRDSIVEIILEETENGTNFRLIHTDLESLAEVEKYRIGWQNHYVDPMTAFFNS